MKTRAFYFCTSILLIAFASCNPAPKLYRIDNKKRISIFQLDNTSLNTVKKYLSNFSSKAIQDTIIIMYDYNHEQCWNYIDKEWTDENLKQVFHIFKPNTRT